MSDLTANVRDKNLIFTPQHITNFICKALKINSEDRVIDPSCGYGAFLEAANKITYNVFGIELAENVHKVAHERFGDKVINANFFDCEELVRDKNFTVALMNPPYNSDGDKTNGFVFVERMLDLMCSGYVCAILPIRCAIGSTKELSKVKNSILEKHTLDAVFTLPSDLFHPVANVPTCCMIFKVGVPNNTETFFGYFKDDGFVKKKNMGRVQKADWNAIEEEWLKLYNNRETVRGKCVTKLVNCDDEWLCEAYMETDYSQLQQSDFEKVLRDYIAFQIQTSDMI